MDNTITRTIANWAGDNNRSALLKVLSAVGDRLSSQSLATAGLAIKTGGSAIVKTGAAAYYGIAGGVLVTKAAATDMTALAGTVANATFNVYAFYVDSAGTLTTTMGTAGATLARVVFPQTPIGKAMLGFIVVNPTGTGGFVGGTTALDDATVVPNVVYVNTVGAVDPTILV